MSDCLTIKPLFLILFIALAGRNVPAQRPHDPPTINDAFAEAELLALQAIGIERFEDSDPLVTRPDGSLTVINPSRVAMDAADAEAVTSQEKSISALVENIYENKSISNYPPEVLKKSPTLEKDVNGYASRINTCIWAEEDALRKRSAKLPRVCNDDIIQGPPKTKEEMSTVQRKIDAEVRATERRVASLAGNVPARQQNPQSASLRNDIPAIAKAANGAVVSIVMSDKNSKPIAQGSGFLVSKDGVIVTNYHVISEGSSAIVKFPDGAFYVVDGVLASDKARDVAVIKAHGGNFRTLTLGNSDQIQVGEEVVAIGNPLSLESTVSNGIVSGIRTAEEEGSKFLQVTAPISPGSSGGPLFNMVGEVVGITTLYLKGGENLNFAIPINDAKRLLLAKFSKIQALPNETVPVKTQTHDGDAPSTVRAHRAEPTAVEIFALRTKCADIGDKMASDGYGFVGMALTSAMVSHYSSETNRCYIEFTVTKNFSFTYPSVPDNYRTTSVYDGQTKEQLVIANQEGNKSHGIIWTRDEQYVTYEQAVAEIDRFMRDDRQ